MGVTEIPLSNSPHLQVKVEPHRFLNVCKRVVTCYDLDCIGIEELCSELAPQHEATPPMKLPPPPISLRSPPRGTPPSPPRGTPSSPPRDPKLRATVIESLNPASGTLKVWMSGGTGEAAKASTTGALRKDQRGTTDKITVKKALKALTKPSRKDTPTQSPQSNSKPLLKQEVHERLGKAINSIMDNVRLKFVHGSNSSSMNQLVNGATITVSTPVLNDIDAMLNVDAARCENCSNMAEIDLTDVICDANTVVPLSASRLRLLQDTTMIESALDLDSLEESSVGTGSQAGLIKLNSV
uniref:Uncharacterized protein n=1 Tax=Timema douglasi TaxID=61478 RepID=A0A7R8ZG50_TIMDO|nr:unnamed protein product [Timema douglasi]